MTKIEQYVNGINHDLENVIPKEGHILVRESIREQARRLGQIATHNNKFLEMMMDEFFTMLEDRWDIVKIGEYDTWHRIEHEQLMNDFRCYLQWGLDAVTHFDDEREE